MSESNVRDFAVIDGSKLYFKVSEKGGVSIYGLGRFPVTLYASQWGKILNRIDDLRSFLHQHWNELKHHDGQA